MVYHDICIFFFRLKLLIFQDSLANLVQKSSCSENHTVCYSFVEIHAGTTYAGLSTFQAILCLKMDHAVGNSFSLCLFQKLRKTCLTLLRHCWSLIHTRLYTIIRILSFLLMIQNGLIMIYTVLPFCFKWYTGKLIRSVAL